MTRPRSRLTVAIGVVLVIAAGLASRKFPGLLPAAFDKYPGDALWAWMVYLLWALLHPRASIGTLAMLALGTSFLDEISQLYQAPWINAIRHTTVGHLVLGTVFGWGDLAAYTVGVVMAASVDHLAQAFRQGSPWSA